MLTKELRQKYKEYDMFYADEFVTYVNYDKDLLRVDLINNKNKRVDILILDRKNSKMLYENLKDYIEKYYNAGYV